MLSFGMFLLFLGAALSFTLFRYERSAQAQIDKIRDELSLLPPFPYGSNTHERKKAS